VAGGRFDAPQRVRGLAWRQRRSRDAGPDEVIVYVPSLRKVRRALAAWADALYLPRYDAGAGGGGTLAVGPSGGGASRPSGGGTLAATGHARRGFTALALRAEAYAWRLATERDVLAPLNAARSGYPSHPAREFGASGLSFASDRWELRRAIVLEGALLERRGDHDRLTLYVDAQTHQPLYWATTRRAGRELVEVGLLVHRFSDDVPGYPAWPDGSAAAVFDPVAAAAWEPSERRGWRRESYDVRSVPLPEEEVERITSPGYLERGR
jgi:hypothetical protein